MNPQLSKTLTIVLSALGVILILAGVFHIIPMNYGLFLGIAAFIISGIMKSLGAPPAGS